MRLYIFVEISRMDAMQKKIFNLYNLRNQQEKTKNRQKCTRNKYFINNLLISINFYFELFAREFIM